MKIKYLGRGCPICGGKRNDCRRDLHSGLWFCRAEVDNSQFKFLKYDKHGFGVFVHVQDYVDYSNKSQEERDRYREERRSQAQTAKQRKIREIEDYTLPHRLRDIEYRKVLNQLGLSKKDRQKIIERCKVAGILEERAIELFVDCKTVKQWQDLKEVANPMLAGVSMLGEKLIIPNNGVLIPVKNFFGEIIAYQVRLSRPTKEHKYLWCSSERKRFSRPTAHFRGTEELPIAYCGDREIAETIGLCESVGYKPAIASETLGMDIIGVSGGAYASAKTQILQVLHHKEAIRVIIYPDAGSLVNRHVYQQIKKAIHWLHSEGYEVQIADWGQWSDKNAKDIDEINPKETEIELRHPYEFLDKNKKFQRAIDWIVNLQNSAYAAYRKDKREQQKKQESENIRLTYKPGNLPIYDPGDLAKVKFYLNKESDRVLFYEEAIAKGWPYVFDSSPTGTGKSYQSGKFAALNIADRRVLYLSKDHRNPTTAMVERNFRDVPVRHNGMVYDPSQKTETGRQFIRYSKGEDPDISSNCLYAEVFHKIGDRGYSQLNEESSVICNFCQNRVKCATGKGDGYGYIYEKSLALEENNLRTHPKSLPPSDRFNYSKAVMLFDEYSNILTYSNNTICTKTDFEKTIGQLAIEKPEILPKIREITTILSEGFQDKDSLGRYGLKDAAIRSRISNYEILKEAIADLEELAKKNIREALKDIDGQKQVNVSGKVDKRTKKQIDFANQYLDEQASKEAAEKLDKLQSNWLYNLLEVLSYGRGGLRFTKKGFSIEASDRRLIDKVDLAQCAIFQDATGSRFELSLILECKESDILQVSVAPGDLSNFQIYAIPDFGLCNKQRSDALAKRLDIFENCAIAKHGEEQTVILDYKNAPKYKDGWWFNHNRGSNEWRDKKAYVAIGSPYPDIGQLQCLWACLGLKPDDPRFDRFCRSKAEAEIVQAIGRARANKRRDEKIYYYSINNLDHSFLQDYGYSYQQVESWQLFPDAAGKKQKTLIRIARFLERYLEIGQKIAQTSIAKGLKISQPYVSKLAKKAGGWAAFEKLLLRLLVDLNRVSNNDDMSRDEDMIGFLGDRAIKEIEPIMDELGIFDSDDPLWLNFLAFILAYSRMTIKLQI